MPRYGYAIFYGGDGHAEMRLRYGLEYSLWLMQYQDDEQDGAVVTQNWNTAQRVQPGD